MNSDRVKGKAKEIAGRTERKAGSVVGSKKAQVKGSLLQAEGAVQSTWGQAKDKVSGVLKKSRAEARKPADAPRTTVKTRTTRTTTTRTKRV